MTAAEQTIANCTRAEFAQAIAAKMEELAKQPSHNWADAGTAGKVASDLADIAEFLGIEL